MRNYTTPRDFTGGHRRGHSSFSALPALLGQPQHTGQATGVPLWKPGSHRVTSLSGVMNEIVDSTAQISAPEPITRASVESPYALDAKKFLDFDLGNATFFFDGVFKGDYSLAIVNRYLARSLIQKGIDISVHPSEEGWSTDRMLNDMQDVRARCMSNYPTPKSFDVHLRNTWPPKADDMVGRRLNAYVCFAWEELAVPRDIVDHFNSYLDLIMVTANFVEKSLKHSGVTVPIAVVGNGTDHIVNIAGNATATQEKSSRRVFYMCRHAFRGKGRTCSSRHSPKPSPTVRTLSFTSKHLTIHIIRSSKTSRQPAVKGLALHRSRL